MPEKEKVVYQILNIENGKEYIGSTIERKKRWEEHKRQLSNGDHFNSYLQNAWEKYGKNSFEFSVLEEVNEEDNLLEKEQKFLDRENPEYNIALYADTPMRGEKHTKEWKEMMSKKMSGKGNPFYGKEHTEESLNKISKHRSGVKHTEEWKEMMSKRMNGKGNPFYGKNHDKETRQKMSENRKAENVSEEIKQKMSAIYKSESPSDETRRKISEALKGRKLSEETKRKIGETEKGEDNSQSKLTEKNVKVIKHLLNGDHLTQDQISKIYNVSQSTIGRVNNEKCWSHVNI